MDVDTSLVLDGVSVGEWVRDNLNVERRKNKMAVQMIEQLFERSLKCNIKLSFARYFCCFLIIKEHRGMGTGFFECGMEGTNDRTTI